MDFGGPSCQSRAARYARGLEPPACRLSQPSTDEQATAVMHNPRYWQQWNRDHLVRTLNTSDVGLNSPGLFAAAGASRRDWSVNLGSGANAGARVYPAKYFFQITSANCASWGAPDYVVFSTGLLGTSLQASIVAFTTFIPDAAESYPRFIGPSILEARC